MTAAAAPAAQKFKPRAIPPYPPIGRQPETLHIIPSKPNPWYGRIVANDDLTLEQRRALDELGSRAPTETMVVRRYATDREMYWGGHPRPYFEFVCPVVTRKRDGRIYVLSPIGDKKLIRDDGWVF